MSTSIYLTTADQEVYLKDNRNDVLRCLIIKDTGSDYEVKLFNGSRMVVSKQDFRAFRRAK